MKFNFLWALCLALFAFSSCKDDGQVGSLIQPEEDLLNVFSNKIDLKSSSILIDTTLSKSNYFFLGEYTDEFYGRTKMEFASKIDSRADGLTLPNTTVVTATSSYSGILDTLLKGLDSKYGKITSIEEPTDFKVDSAFFVLDYTNDIFGDSTALQAVNIYALDKSLESGKRFFTSTDISEYCSKENLIGSVSYQIKNSRRIKIPVDMELIKKITDFYIDNHGEKTQKDFDEILKGVYVSHSFNGGGIIKIELAGFSIYYTYEAKIKTSYDKRDTTINTKDILNKNGNHIRVLASNVFLSANKSVSRMNIVSQPELNTTFNSKIKSDNNTHIYTPAGIYTKISIPFKAIVDSVDKYSHDTSKVLFNSARLMVWNKGINWKTEMSKTPSTHLLLMHKDSVIPFFFNNRTPDGETSFVAAYDTASCSYTFDITKALQMRFHGKSTFSDEMVILPVVRTMADNSGYEYVYLYGQQLWITSTILYGSEAEEANKRPRIDLIYTRRDK